MMSQLTLALPEAEKFGVLRYVGTLPQGLIFEPSFVSAAEEKLLIDVIDAAENWAHDLKRRVQHYGFRYDYRSRALSSQDKVGDLPAWMTPLAERLIEHGYFDQTPDQVIVNEYMPGQGISSHVDRETCFGSTVASLSLGADTVMEFSSPDGERGSLLVERRSLLVLRGDARYRWEHAIPARKRDRVGHDEIWRARRVSLTFRTVILH